MLFYRVAILLECIDNSADVTEDTRQFAEAVDVVMDALCLIPCLLYTSDAADE